ncbi:MAG: glycosyltransferase family 4 protein [Nitrospirota bacterium]
MVILYTETLKKWGGQQNRILTEAVGLSRRNHRVILVCHRNSMLAVRAKEAGLTVYEVNMVKQAHLLTIPKLMKIIKEEKVDLVVTNSSVDSWAGGIAAKMKGKRLVRIKHNLNPVKSNVLTRFVYSLPDRFVSVSGQAYNMLIKSGYIPPEKIDIVYAAVDVNMFNPDIITDEEKKRYREEIGIPGDALVIGNTSGFAAVKGQGNLIRAINELMKERDDIVLLLAGWYSSSRNIYDLVSQEFRNRVFLPGLVNNVPLALGIMDIFVFPSIKEAFGISLIEAMAMAMPVIVSDIPTFRGFVRDGVNGLLFRSGDSRDLLDVLRSLVGNPGLRKFLGSGARHTVMEKFRLDNMINEMDNIYNNILNCQGEVAGRNGTG